MSGKNYLSSTKAPSLPFAQAEFSREYTDTTHNILRQYFNTIDNLTGQLLAASGGRFLSFPHIAAQHSDDQYATATNVATKVLWDTLDSGLGFTLNPNSTATPDYTGVYKIDYSLQVFNTASQIHELYVWLKVNNINVPGSTSIFSVPERHGAINGALIAYSSVTFMVTGGDEVALYWATNQAATSGGGTGVYLHHENAQTIGTPPNDAALPSTPSAIGSIVFVSGIPPTP
jgi:hypothetical protein